METDMDEEWDQRVESLSVEEGERKERQAFSRESPYHGEDELVLLAPNCRSLSDDFPKKHDELSTTSI
jgi:hypothetical protein